jgi:hypothetical protein
MPRSLLFPIIASILFNVQAQDISFSRENLTFRIEDSFFYLNGTYFLRNEKAQSHEVTLFYPFPVDSLYGEVDSIILFNMNSNKEIKEYRTVPKGILFEIRVDSVTCLHISYRQKLLGNQARYILTTTRQWRKPLEEARYQLLVPQSLQIVTFSYPPDHMEETDGYTVYFWEKKSFLPGKDLDFTFRKEGP